MLLLTLILVLMKILHMTPHLGGGVGKALWALVSHRSPKTAIVNRRILCLDNPQKNQFLCAIEAAGIPVIINPTRHQIRDEIKDADVVQIEFWDHPSIYRALCQSPIPPLRLVVWFHRSGLHYPLLPLPLVGASDRFVLTGECSRRCRSLGSTPRELAANIRVISSGSVNEIDSDIQRIYTENVKVGYVGTLDFSKLHPSFVEYMCTINDESFSVELIGDDSNKDSIVYQCGVKNRSNVPRFSGYRTDVAQVFKHMDIIVYLLNPTHYGTSENVLLEAMASGVVPIVLNNEAETHIVSHGKNGLVVRDMREFSEAYQWLKKNPLERRRLSKNAMIAIREKFNVNKSVEEFNSEYQTVLKKPKRLINFKAIFGDTPLNWLESFGLDTNCDGDSRYLLLKTLSTFVAAFPDDHELQAVWHLCNSSEAPQK